MAVLTDFIALFPESIKMITALAGLLTRSIFERLPGNMPQRRMTVFPSGSFCSKTRQGTHSSGSVRDFHPVPFSPEALQIHTFTLID